MTELRRILRTHYSGCQYVLRGSDLADLEWLDETVSDPRDRIRADWDELLRASDQVAAARRDHARRRRAVPGAQRQVLLALIEHALDPTTETRAELERWRIKLE